MKKFCEPADVVRQHWPNNKPRLVTLEEMEGSGFALDWNYVDSAREMEE